MLRRRRRLRRHLYRRGHIGVELCRVGLPRAYCLSVAFGCGCGVFGWFLIDHRARFPYRASRHKLVVNPPIIKPLSQHDRRRRVTVERLECAIKTTARVMARHDLAQLMPILKRLEEERDRLIRDGDPIEYAKRLLGKDAA